MSSDAVASLTAMGFTVNAARRALHHRSDNVAAAVEWLFEHAGDPGLDDDPPLAPAVPAAAAVPPANVPPTAGGGAQLHDEGRPAAECGGCGRLYNICHGSYGWRNPDGLWTSDPARCHPLAVPESPNQQWCSRECAGDDEG